MIAIPNMEMPSCCALCDLCFGFGCAVSEHDKGYKTRAFKYDENGKCEVDVFHERASWCPLIEIDDQKIEKVYITMYEPTNAEIVARLDEMERRE